MEKDPKSLNDESQIYSKQTQIDESSIFHRWFDFTENLSSKVEK